MNIISIIADILLILVVLIVGSWFLWEMWIEDIIVNFKGKKYRRLTFESKTTNPKGFRKGYEDCYIRSISLYTGKTWEEVYRGLTDLGIELGRSFATGHVVAKYLHSLGYKRKKHKYRQYFKHANFKELTLIGGKKHLAVVDSTTLYDATDTSNNRFQYSWRLKEKKNEVEINDI